MNAHEEWRPVDGFSYEVSSLGRVRRGNRILTPRVHGHGYHRVSLCGAGKPKDAYIHRLVCLAFHGPAPSAEYHADHIDGSRDNNAASNLRWLSPVENRARRNIARGESSGLSKLTEDEVRLILLTSDGFRTDRDLAESLGISREQVRDVRLRKSWRHVSC